MMLVRLAALLLLTGAVLGGTIRWWRTARNLPDGRDELRIAYSDNISGLDPRNLRSPPSLTQRMTDAVWDELIAFDPQTLKPVPRIAEDWQVLDQGRRYLIRLGQGHRWSNGDPVTAGDFVRTVRWLLAKDADHPLLRLLGEAGRSPAAGQDGRDEISVSAPDRFTLEIRLREAPPDFVPMLAALCWIPLHESSVEAFERGDWSEPDRLVSNGPFRLRYFGPAEVLLDRNPHHGERTGYARVRLLRTESPLLYPMLLRAGRVAFADALNFLPRNFPPRVPGVTMEHENTASVSTLQFNATRPPLQDPRVRRALSLALDRAALAARLGGGGALPAYSFTPPGQFGNKPEQTVAEDLGEARRLLAEAGYPEGRGFPVLRLPVVGGSDMNPLPFLCAEQWRARLGLRVYTPVLSREDFSIRASRGDFDAVHYRWVASPLDFSTLSQQVGAPLHRPFRQVADSRVAEMVGEARRLGGPARLQAMLAAEGEFMRQMPATPVLLYHRYTLRADTVEGWRHDIFGRHPLRELRPPATTGGESQ